MKPKLHNTPQAAEFLGFQPCTLEAWRLRGGGPKYLKIGRLVKYAEADLLAFLDGARVSNTAQTPANVQGVASTALPPINVQWVR